MQISTIYPAGIVPGNGHAVADFFMAFLAGIHLDRKTARSIGWDGMRPCLRQGFSWTLRATGSKGVFGVQFVSESFDETGVTGEFALYFFPDEDTPIVNQFSLAARSAAAQGDYLGHIRDFVSWELSHFFLIGTLRVQATLSGDGLAVFFESPARMRVVSLQADATPLGWEQDIPALCLGQRLWHVLVNSLSHMLQEAPRFARKKRNVPLPAVMPDGEWGVMADEYLTLVELVGCFGKCSVPDELDYQKYQGNFHSHPISQEEKKLPVLHVVSGFLGSGKTTFVSQWLAWLHGHDRYTAVIQNEIGKINLDALLLADETLCETVDEGCVCCSLADSLRPAIRRMLETFPVEQMILETTGLANPVNILDAMPQLSDVVQKGLLIIVVNAHSLCQAQPDFLELCQIRSGHVLVLSKTDMLSQDDIQRAKNVLKQENPEAVIFEGSWGAIPFGFLDKVLEAEQARNGTFLPRYIPRSTHIDEGYTSWALRQEYPATLEALELAVLALGQVAERIKGIVHVDGHGLFLVQYTAGKLEMAPAGTPHLRGSNEDEEAFSGFLVVIGKRLEAHKESLQKVPEFFLSV